MNGGEDDYEEMKHGYVKPLENKDIAEFYKRPLIQFANAKQIIEECEKVLKEEGLVGPEDTKIFNFRELLSWKMPEHFCSTTSAHNNQFNRLRIQAPDMEEGLVTNQIQLYKLDFVTQRLKEQRVNFVGVVTHVKQHVRSSLLI